VSKASDPVAIVAAARVSPETRLERDFAATLTSLTAVAEIEEANRSRWI
jgi:hypothetical protein